MEILTYFVIRFLKFPYHSVAFYRMLRPKEYRVLSVSLPISFRQYVLRCDGTALSH